MLGEPVGKQDQYAAAHGGICAYTFHRDDTVDVEPLELDAATLRWCRPTDALLHRRDALGLGVLGDQDERTKAMDSEMLDNLHRTKEMGSQLASCSSGDLDGYAELMHEHWLNKRARSAGMAPTGARPPVRDRTEQRRDRRQARRRRWRRVPARLLAIPGHAPALAEEDAHEVRFNFDFQGAARSETQ